MTWPQSVAGDLEDAGRVISVGLHSKTAHLTSTEQCSQQTVNQLKKKASRNAILYCLLFYLDHTLFEHDTQIQDGSFSPLIH